ncbi:MAG: 2Fe-2S iron-sulfur cluster-binding protein [Steroidobacteraceae bacterium]
MLKFHALRVVEVRPEAEEAIALTLEVPRDLAAEYRGSAGQHLVVRVSADGQELRRTYSFTNAPGEPYLRLLVRLQPQGRVSARLARLEPGEQLEVLPPNGSFTPHVAALGAGLRVAFAAGSGITPVLSVTRAVLSAGGAMMVFYGNRSAARTMGLEALQALKDQYPERLALHFIMSQEPQEVALYNGRLERGKVRELAHAFFDPTEVTEYFVCGPGQMDAEVCSALADLGVARERIRVEHFIAAADGAAALAPSAVASPAPPPTALAEGIAEVTVLLDGRRRTFTMAIDGDSVLDAAERAGLDLPFSCRSGVCSTCRTKVVRGKVRMAENYALEEWELEQGYVLACQSKCLTPELELDYDEK